MKFEFVKKEGEEKVIVYAKNRNSLVNQIEDLVNNSSFYIDGINFNGYLENDIVPLNLNDIVSFYVEDDKTYARIMEKTYLIKFRLYQIEEKLTDNFIRINKSRIINKYYIEKFDVSWSGNLLVVMKNKDKDYVSRRLIPSVKERMNLK